jgi:broad specificity phosphatase PhoE
MSELHDIQPEDLNAIANHMATLHPDVIHKGLGHLISNRILQPHEAVTALEKIGKAREALSKPAEAKEVKPEAATAKPEEKKEEIPKPSEPKDEDKIPIIRPADALKTWEMGSLQGKPETDESQAEMKRVVSSGNMKAGGDGESFNEFRDRALPVLPHVLSTTKGNKALVTHSSVFKLYKTWDSMNRPDPLNMTDEEKKTFADKYNEEETHTGDTESFKNGENQVIVARHGQTEDNVAGNYRKDSTNLTPKGIKQAKEAGEDIKQRLNGEPLQEIISSSLPRTMHTSQLIKDVINNKITDGKQENS